MVRGARRQLGRLRQASVLAAERSRGGRRQAPPSSLGPGCGRAPAAPRSATESFPPRKTALALSLLVC